LQFTTKEGMENEVSFANNLVKN